MKSMFFKQTKPVKVKILGVLVLCLIPFALSYEERSFWQLIIMLLIGLVTLGYSVSYEIKKEFNNYRHIALFGLTIWKQKLDLDFPEYISVFSASFKRDNEWGAVSALGTTEKSKAMVIRLFKGNKYFTLFKTDTYEEVLGKAQELGALLNVEIHDAMKE